MISSAEDIRDVLIGMATNARRPIRVAILDPGTNCAIRYETFEVGLGGTYRWTHMFQTFFAGSVAGTCYVERMAMLSRELLASEMFRTCDLYVAESQFENNVTVSLGVIIGLISAARCGDVTVRTKERTGAIALNSMSYVITTINPRYKTKVIAMYLRPDEIKAQKDLKKRGELAAIRICSQIYDAVTIEMLTTLSKSDDIADTVCYAKALELLLFDPGWKKSIK